MLINHSEKSIIAFIKKNLPFIITVLVIVLYTCLRGTDYIAADAYLTPSSEKIYVSKENDLVFSISPTEKTIRSILFQVGLPKQPSDSYSTMITISQEGEQLYSTTIKNDGGMISEVESLSSEDGLDEEPTEFIFDEAIKLTNLSETYTVSISSDAPNDMSAYSFHLNDDGSVWHRLTYLIFKFYIRIIFCVLLCSAISLFFYFILLDRDKNVKANSSNTRNTFEHPENVFLLVSLILCGLFMLVMPTFLVPDSANHFVRAYGITKGYFIIPSNGQIQIPDNLIPYKSYTFTPYIVVKNFFTSIHYDNLINYDVVNMALYSPFSYLLQAFGIGIANLISNNVYVLYYSGVICNIVGCTAILFLAIKYIPYGKNVILVLSIMPMAVEQRASLSVDAFTYAMTIAVISFVIYFREKKKKMTKNEIAFMFLIIFFMASCKVIYFIAALLILLIPYECFGSKIRNIVTKTIGMITLMTTSIGWFLLANGYLSQTRGGSSASAKLSYIIHNPIRYFYILNSNLWDNGCDYLFGLFGNKLGSTNIEISNSLVFVGLLAVFTVFIIAFLKKINTDLTMRIAMLIIAIGMIALILSSLYIQWTSEAAMTYSVEGVQGRYFLPVIPFMLFAFLGSEGIKDTNNSSIDESKKNLSKTRYSLTEEKCIYAVAITNILCLISVWGHSSFIG